MPVWSQDQYAIKEEFAWLKVRKVYNLFDAKSGKQVMKAHEPNLGWFVSIVRCVSDWRRATPFNVVLEDMDGRPIARIKRGWKLFFSHVRVEDGDGNVMGVYRERFTFMKAQFDLETKDGNKICTLKGNFIGRNFQFITQGDQTVAQIHQKWAGLGKEMLTTADNYVLEIDPVVPSDSPARILILGAVLCIDLVMKE